MLTRPTRIAMAPGMAGLRFGLLLMPSAPRGEAFVDRVQECIEQAVAAEAAGFDLCMLPEHHQDMGFMPQPLLIAGAIASRTSTIRIGTNIALIGLKHPLQVVEEFHSLDVISRGRIVAGVGLGYQEQDFAMFGHDVRQRAALYEDALTVMNLARERDVISYDGAHCSFRDVRVVPQPIQKGGVPIWVGAMSTPAIRRAARLGDGLICGGLDDVEGLRNLVEPYTALAVERRREHTITVNRWAAVGDTHAEARAVLEPHALKAARYYFRHRQEFSGALPTSLQPAWAATNRPEDLAFEAFEQFYVCGTPDECIERIEELEKKLAMANLVLQLQSASGPRHEVILDQIKRFGADVIPHFRKVAPS